MIKAARGAVGSLKLVAAPSDMNTAICCTDDRKSMATAKASLGSWVKTKVPWFERVPEM